ncbi:MAG: lipopolysaccharide biosynthesis protein [Cyanobacteria bacterium J06649_4]
MSEQHENNQELKGRSVRGVFWSLMEQGGSQLTQFLTFLVLARLLAPEAFGLISLANIFIHLAQALVASGFGDAIIQRKTLEKEHLDTAFWINVGIGCLLTVVGFFSAGSVAQFFKEPALAAIVQALSFNVFINSFASTQSAILTRNLNFKGLTARRVISMLIGSTAGITMAAMGFGVWSLVGQTLITSLVGCLLLWRISDWRPGFQVSMTHFKDLFAFGINVVGIGLLVFLSRRIDDFLIGYFLGTAALGYYTVAYKIFLSLMQIIQESTRKVSFTAFAKLQEQPKALRKALYSSTRVISFIGIPAFVGMAAIAPEFVQLFFGEDWLPSIPVMQILAFNGVLVAAMSFTGPLITALGKPGWNLMLLLISTVVRSAAFLLVIDQGIVMIALALVICNYALLPTNLWTLWKLAQIGWAKFIAQTIPSLLASGIMATGVLGFKALCGNMLNTQLLLASGILIGAITYSLAAWVLMPDVLRKLTGLVRSALASNASN